MTNSEVDPEPDPVELLQGYGKDLNLLRTLFIHLGRPNDDNNRPAKDDSIPVTSDIRAEYLTPASSIQAPQPTQMSLGCPDASDSYPVTSDPPAKQRMLAQPTQAPQPIQMRLRPRSDSGGALPVASDLPAEHLMPPPPPPPPKLPPINPRKRKATSPPYTDPITPTPVHPRSPPLHLRPPTPLSPLPAPHQRSYPEQLTRYERFCLKRKLMMLQIHLFNAEKLRQGQRAAERRITERINARIAEYEKQSEREKKPEKALGWKVAQFEHQWRGMMNAVKGLEEGKGVNSSEHMGSSEDADGENVEG